MTIGQFMIRFFTPLAWVLFPFKTIGKENIPPQNPDDRLILCANHISDLDPMFLEMCQKRHIYFMAKAELFSNKLSNWFFGKQLGAFPVKRGAGDTSAIDKSQEIVNSGRLLGIFPEGTRSRTGQLGRAKSGASLIASQTGASIIPVCICTKNQKIHLFRKTYIIIGKAISPQDLHLDNPEHPDLRYASRLIMDTISQMMTEKMGTPKGADTSSVH